jgi:hypothetical protein
MDRDVYGTNLKRHRGGAPDEKWFHHVASRRDVYKLGEVFEVEKEFRIRSVTLCELPTIAGLEQT